MPNAKDLKPLENFKGLFVGRSGTRKTSSAASWPKPMYDFDIDRRIQGLRGLDIEYDQFDFGMKGFEKLEQKLDKFIAYPKGSFPFATVLFDSLSTFERLAVHSALDITEGNVRPDGSKPGLRMGTIQIPDLLHYKYRAVVAHQIIYEYLKALPCNVIVSAHIVDKYDVKGQVCGKKLLNADKLAEEFPINFDETWEFFAREEGVVSTKLSYYCRFRGELAKTTFFSLEDVVDITDKNTFDGKGNSFYDSLVKRLC